MDVTKLIVESFEGRWAIVEPAKMVHQGNDRNGIPSMTRPASKVIAKVFRKEWADQILEALRLQAGAELVDTMYAQSRSESRTTKAG